MLRRRGSGSGSVSRSWTAAQRDGLRDLDEMERSGFGGRSSRTVMVQQAFLQASRLRCFSIAEKPDASALGQYAGNFPWYSAMNTAFPAPTNAE